MLNIRNEMIMVKLFYNYNDFYVFCRVFNKVVIV